jgi:hypothetical protein
LAIAILSPKRVAIFQSDPRWCMWLLACFSQKRRRPNSVIRIETHQTQNHLTFKVAGKLCGVSVAAFEDCWKAAHLDSPAAERAVDLSEVNLIDKTGWCLLRRMHRDGVRFSAKGLAGQSIVDGLNC